jgi:hypothetical protein
MTDDQLGVVLAAQPWRTLCALRETTGRDADPILGDDEQLDDEDYETLTYELHHAILPALADDGFVTFDREADKLTRGPAFLTVRPLLDYSTGRLETVDAGPFVYDEQIGTVRYDPDTDRPGERVAAFVDEG